MEQQLGEGHPVFRASTGNPSGHLHDQCHRVVEYVAAESDQDKRLVSKRRLTLKTALPGAEKHREEMDVAGSKLESGTEPIRDNLRRPNAVDLIENGPRFIN